MKILVTGGAGFIASHIVDKYLDLGHSVIVVDNFSTGKRENLNYKAKFYEIDIRNRVAIKEIFVKEKPEILSHHAAQINLRKSIVDPLFDAEVNILGLLNLLEQGVKNGLKKIIFPSSAAVYGEAKVLPTPEDYQPKLPFSPYGIAKLTAEYYLNHYFRTYKLPSTILRYANVYGPRQDPFGEGGVVSIFIKKFLDAKTPTINGDGKQTRDFIYVEDIVTANVLALDVKTNGVINIGTGKEISINRLFEVLSRLTEETLKGKHGQLKSGETKRSVLDIALAKKILGWRAQTNLIQGLEKTIRFLKNR